MERVGQWRVVEAEEAQRTGPVQPTAADDGTAWRRVAVLVAIAVLGVVGIAIWATLPQGGVQLDVAGSQAALVDLGTSADEQAGVVAATAEPALVVDVQGAVAQPGVHELPAGSRVADAIAAAGGYSAQVDIAAAAQLLNLAERLSDGVKIHVPARGEGAPLTQPVGVAAPQTNGLIDINRASAEELESLPGIGPVTAEKIIAAREQQPFASIDELDTRDVVGPSTLDEIRDLVTVTP